MKQFKVKDIHFIILWVVMIGFVGFAMYFHWLTEENIIQYITKQTVVKEVVQEPETLTVLVEREEMDYTKYSNVKLNVKNIIQNPELPTGCEVTSLTIVLNYLGHPIDKLTLTDLFLPQGEIGKTNPDVAFIGSPRDEYSYGANAPVLEKTANDYLDKVNSKYNAYTMYDTEFKDLLKYINDGYPVMVWETINMLETYPTTKWTIDNQEVQWYANFHCVVLIGYTEDKYIIADPLQGIVEYDKELVESRYNDMSKQAIVIY